MAIERIYFEINEVLAKSSKAMWSFSDYVTNSATEEYKKEVDRFYLIVDKFEEKRPERLEEAKRMAERFSKSLANWKNKGFSIDMMCPSVMICGAGNFPVKKKLKQNAAHDKHMKEYQYIHEMFNKIENLLHGSEIIKSGDEDAIEKLQEKLNELEALQVIMKNANAFFRKNKTLQGFTELKHESIDKIMEYIQKNGYGVPFESFELTNNNAKIKNTKQRLERLQKAKQSGTKEVAVSEVCKIIENTDIMRLQLIFEGKPEEEVRNILKSNGFKWSPTNSAWQRQLTENARYSAKKVIENISNLKK